MAAATLVFAARGISGASVEEICEAAGFTRGAFYSNFAHKDALVLALIEQGVQLQFAAAERAIAEMKAAPASLRPEELLSLALTAFEAAGRSSPDSVLTQQEMLLHAARQPTLRAPYLAFTDECVRQLTALVADAIAHLGLRFTCPLSDAVELLAAAHEHASTQALFTGRLDSRLLQVLVGAITEPR